MTTPTNPAPESAGHVHTYNIAGVCVTCGHDADALATDHHFCENDDSPTRGATMVLDMLARIVTSDRDDADVGLMVRRVLNEPTLKAIRKAASAPAAPQPRETRCDPDVPHYYGLPATGCFNCFPPGSPDPYASTDDGKGASPEGAGGETWKRGRWWRVRTPEGKLWAETSDEQEARDIAAEKGWPLEHLWVWTQEEWGAEGSTPAAPQPETGYRRGFEDARRLAEEHFGGHECEPDCAYQQPETEGMAERMIDAADAYHWIERQLFDDPEFARVSTNAVNGLLNRFDAWTAAKNGGR